MTGRAAAHRGFWALIVTQFQGAFSDNALKALVTFLGLNLVATKAQHASVVPLVGIIFSLPFIFFSMAGGCLADRFSKRTVSIGVKAFEIGIMLFAFVGLWHQQFILALVAVALMGVHSAFFGPSKYGLLPELLPENRLSWGNGILELGTFLAIILGGVAGGLLYEAFKAPETIPWELCSLRTSEGSWKDFLLSSGPQGRHSLSALILLVLAAGGLVASLGITRVPAANPTKPFRINFLGDLWVQVRRIRGDRVLWIAVLGNTYFFYVGALILQNAILFGTDTLRVGEFETSCLQAALALGIGLGSFAAGFLSGGKIESGLVPFGALGMAVFSVLLGLPSLTYRGVLGLLALLGFSGGFFIVPICAIMQHRPDRRERGSVLASANLLSFVGIAAASGIFWLLTAAAGGTTRQVFVMSGAMNLAAAAGVLLFLPDAFLRLILWTFTHSVYRIRVEGRENLPQRGSALFVADRISWVDGLLLMAATDRSLRLMVNSNLEEGRFLKLLILIARAIPASARLHPGGLIRAFREARRALRDGESIALSLGASSRTAARGFGRIFGDADVSIVPVRVERPRRGFGFLKAARVRFGPPQSRPAFRAERSRAPANDASESGPRNGAGPFSNTL
ncbi:MAG: MFS transporter [Verrucomicrobiae bacterium]|nr:MFS transporter [Verrucomicrobiae bacterium]